LDEVHCIFVGSLSNLGSLVRQYGLCGKSTNEAMLVIEAYRTLRDRGPYPADQVLKDLNGSFAFVVYDNETGSVLAASVRMRPSLTVCFCRLKCIVASQSLLFGTEFGRGSSSLLGDCGRWVCGDL